MIATHSIKETKALSNQMCILKDGLIRFSGTVDDLVEKYGNCYNIQILYIKEKEEAILKIVKEKYESCRISEIVGNQMILEVEKTKSLNEMFEDFEEMYLFLLIFLVKMNWESFYTASLFQH